MHARRIRLASALLSLLVPALALAPVLARGDAPTGHSEHSEHSEHKKRGDAAASAAFATACAQGNAKYAARDFDGAIAQYQKAIELAPHQGQGYYLLGEAEVAAGNLSDAEASYNRAALETGEKDPSLRARILFVTADLRERQKKREDAKAAWQAYLDWAAKYPDAGVFPSSAQSRQQVMDTVIKQDKADEVVRERIAATADGGVFSDPNKSPPTK
jgi:tetratricopeptide (TPR) repeat protein